LRWFLSGAEITKHKEDKNKSECRGEANGSDGGDLSEKEEGAEEATSMSYSCQIS